MGRWDELAERKPQELKEYALSEAARIVAEELRTYPPRIEEWLDPALREKYREALSRPSPPPEATMRVACELARRELLRDYELVDRFFQRGADRAGLPHHPRGETGHFPPPFPPAPPLHLPRFG